MKEGGGERRGGGTSEEDVLGLGHRRRLLGEEVFDECLYNHLPAKMISSFKK